MASDFLGDFSSKSAIIKRQILVKCIEKGQCSIADLSSASGISVPTATKLVGELIDDHFLQDNGKIGTSGGRRPSVYGLDPNAGYYLGVDVARQHFHIAVSDFKGEIILFIQDIEFVLEASADSFRKMCSMIKDEVRKANIKWEKILGVGVSLSGRVNPEKGFSLTYFVSDDIPIKDLFQKELGVPVNIENDSRAMAYGEYMSLGNKSNPNMLFINLSWGLGMGMIIDGKLYYGTSGFSGEIGHFPFIENGIMCRCGKIGCFETAASGSALKRWILEKLSEGRQSSLKKITEAGGEIHLHHILEAIEEGDILAIEGIGEIGNTLGRGLAGLINIFNPGLVIIGGRLIVGKDYLMLPIKTAINKHSLAKVASDTKIQFSELDRRAASVGDCLLTRGKLLGIL